MTCEWAGCDLPAVAEAAGWHFCKPHLREHHEVMGEDYRRLYGNQGGGPCGTYAAYCRHKLHKETPCEPCVDARRRYDRERKRRRSA